MIRAYSIGFSSKCYWKGDLINSFTEYMTGCKLRNPNAELNMTNLHDNLL